MFVKKIFLCVNIDALINCKIFCFLYFVKKKNDFLRLYFQKTESLFC